MHVSISKKFLGSFLKNLLVTLPGGPGWVSERHFGIRWDRRRFGRGRSLQFWSREFFRKFCRFWCFWSRRDRGWVFFVFFLPFWLSSRLTPAVDDSWRLLLITTRQILFSCFKLSFRIEMFSIDSLDNSKKSLVSKL